MRRLLTIMFLSWIVLTGSQTLASQGTLGLEPVILNEISWVQYPGGSAKSAVLYLPRFGAIIVYGVTNHFDFSAGMEFSLDRNVTLKNVSVQSVANGTLRATYRSITVPLKLSYCVSVGEVSFAAALGVGIEFSQWQDNSVLARDGIPFYIEENSSPLAGGGMLKICCSQDISGSSIRRDAWWLP